jgi:hypothetical protein
VGHSEREIRSLRSEFRIQKELSHPNIVRQSGQKAGKKTYRRQGVGLLSMKVFCNGKKVCI